MTRPVALVTGASSGIGAAFARILAERDHDLVVVARDRARLEAIAKEVDDRHGVRCEVLGVDLTDAEQLPAVEARVGEVDLLVNNAGFGTAGVFHELDVEIETRQVRLNVLALLRLTHAAARAMAPRGRGGILNVASVGAFQPVPRNATYAATKAFVLSFTEAVHEELRGRGVHVSCLCPGFTRTEFQERAGIDDREVPGFLWHDPATVAHAGLEGLARNRAVVVPGPFNKAAAGFTRAAPQTLTRKIAGLVTRRAVGR